MTLIKVLIKWLKRTDGFWQLIESFLKPKIPLLENFDQLKMSSEIRSSDRFPLKVIPLNSIYCIKNGWNLKLLLHFLPIFNVCYNLYLDLGNNFLCLISSHANGAKSFLFLLRPNFKDPIIFASLSSKDFSN